MTSDAARWGPDAPTPDQLKEFFAQVAARRITKDSLQEFMRHGASPAMTSDEGEAAAPIVGAARQVRDFPVWKTVKLGTGLTTADDFRKALKTQGCRIGDLANDILGKPAFIASESETEADLVKVTVAELGFKEGARYDKICVRGQEFGLKLCPNEVGPQLRIQYLDQPFGEWLIVAMEPISGSDGRPEVWCVARHGRGSWLSTGYGDPEHFWNPGGTFVFVRPRK